MPGYIHSVANSLLFYSLLQATVHDVRADKTLLSDGRYSYESRGLRRQCGWSHNGGLWPTRSGFYCDPATPTREDLSQCLNGGNAGAFEPWSCGVGGNATQNFIMGRCKDADGNGVSGAVVQTFRTSDDAFVSETTASADGYYEAPTAQPPGTAHYIVAYRAGSPDIAGTTVNTLTATKRDGSAP